MSRTQFIEYRGRGFWAHDVSLGVFLKHLIDVAADHGAASGSQWLTEAIPTWRRVAVISDFGLNLNGKWTEAQLAAFLNLIDDTCASLDKRDGISVDEIRSWRILNDVGISTRGMDMVRIGPVVQLGRAITALVNGSLPAAPACTWWLYGIENGPGTVRKRSDAENVERPN